jgi:hypothetical protein
MMFVILALTLLQTATAGDNVDSVQVAINKTHPHPHGAQAESLAKATSPQARHAHHEKTAFTSARHSSTQSQIGVPVELEEMKAGWTTLSDQKCNGAAYTAIGASSCNGFGGISADECANKCQIQETPEGCSAPSTPCVAAVYYKSRGYCHLYDEANGCASPTVQHGVDIFMKKAAKMACNDATEGFFSYEAAEVTGLRKSCSRELPYILADKTCAGEKCEVDPDRQTCCRAKECLCPGGTAATGDACKAEGQQSCSECDSGHYLGEADAEGNKQCHANECTCTGGTKTTATGETDATQCKQNGEEDCSECKDGYTFENRKCTAKVCTCSNGVQAEATGNGASLCSQAGEDCASCNDGYTAFPTPAADTMSVCKPITCSRDIRSHVNLPTDAKYDTSACTTGDADLNFGATCKVSCGSCYTGDEDATYTCGADGQLSGTRPTCAKVCNPEDITDGKKCFPAHSHNTTSCAKTGNPLSASCDVKCNDGYIPNPSGSSTWTAEYHASAKGWECVAPENGCEAAPCTITAPANGGLGDCPASLASGASCTIECNEGYAVTGTTSCSAGTPTIATCKQQTCVATDLQDGYVSAGDCTSSLASGSTCTPVCQTGFVLKGVTSCDEGITTYATCESNLECKLEHGKTLGDHDKGYWTIDASAVTYKGCENWCAAKDGSISPSERVSGCELATVTSSERATSGYACFAHIEAWSSLKVTDQANTAACKRPEAPAA